MSLITYNGLIELVERGVITGVPLEHVNAASIDVTLGRWLWSEDPRGGTVHLKNKDAPHLVKYDLLHNDYRLTPGEFVLAQTQEMFFLPNDIACEFRLKSSTARSGIDQSFAAWCDPGWHGSVLTLALRNNWSHHEVVLSYGTKIGQMVFLQGEEVPESHSYAAKGQYNHCATAQPSRGNR